MESSAADRKAEDSGQADACVAWTGFPGAFPAYRDDCTEKHHEFSWLMGSTAAILE